jgi:hypothetical protein
MEERMTINETPIERAAREAAYRATPEGARKILEREKAAAAANDAEEWRRRCGGDDSGVYRAEAKIELANKLLPMTPEAEAEAIRTLGRVNFLEWRASDGGAAASIDPETTPAEAREMLEDLRTDPDFFARMERGGRSAREHYSILTAIGRRGQ